ncbi:MAG: cell wall metabolism sensor histidine kinase WalK [Lachnospiraceae bacterium]|nr:cell wall metabolism sensor histidine kinase WalK [Lachnospiraceae bacterium]
MKTSIRTKITSMVVIFSLLIIGAAWFVCTFIIKSVFVYHVKTSLETTYHSCNEMFKSASEREMIDGDLYGMVDNPISAVVLILDPENKKIYTSINDDGKMMASLEDIILSVEENTNSELEEPGQFEIYINHDPTMNADYYDLVGRLDNGYMVILRAPMAQLDELMSVVSQIYIVTAVILVIFGSIFILIFSNIFSAPIKELNGFAKRMTQLDFDAKVPVATKDEIGELGNSMNEMSKKLERTISELKSANVKLEKDIAEHQQIDDMRREFLSHVSHELKTPIALIQGYAEGLKDSMFDDEENKEFYTEVIIDEAHKMNHMVKRLLNLSEIEFGEAPVEIERFELVQFVRDIVNASSILVEGQDINIVFEQQGPVYVWADEYMMEEVMTNYLTNAIHYVTPGGIIKIYFVHMGNDIRVCVYNQGENIPNEDIDKIFVKFYKVDKARTREYGGNGIGLSIVAASMKAHGKKYGAFNVLDGVVFYFDLDANMPC